MLRKAILKVVYIKLETFAKADVGIAVLLVHVPWRELLKSAVAGRVIVEGLLAKGCKLFRHSPSGALFNTASHLLIYRLSQSINYFLLTN